MKVHLDFKIRNQDWCIIKLKDGTKLRVTTVLTAILKEDDRLGIGTQNLIAVAELPKELWGPPSDKKYPPEELEKNIVEEDMDFKVEKERWNVYELEDGTIVSIKPYVVMVSRTGYYSERGEPIYILNIQPIVKVKRPKRRVTK